jgi:hypothetical protein
MGFVRCLLFPGPAAEGRIPLVFKPTWPVSPLRREAREPPSAIARRTRGLSLRSLHERATRRLPWRTPLSAAIETISSPDRAAAEIPAVLQSNPPEPRASTVTLSRSST